jgi:hypothetical protein
VFGNITADDIANTIGHLPQLCASAATVIWTRHRQRPDLTPYIRQTFEFHGFEEVSFEGDGPFGVGAHRLIAPPKPFQAGLRLFEFVGYDVLQPSELTNRGSSLEEGQFVSEANEQLLHGAYEAFNARDIDGALARMHADVDWPNGMEGGRLRGHREVREYWRRQFDLIDSSVESQRIEHCPDGQVIATVRQLVRDRTGEVISEDVVEHRYVISEGLIERMDIGSIT